MIKRVSVYSFSVRSTSNNGKLQTSHPDSNRRNEDACAQTRRLLNDDSTDITAHVQVKSKYHDKLCISEIPPIMELSSQTFVEEKEAKHKREGLDSNFGLTRGFLSNYNNNHVINTDRSGDTQTVSIVLIDQLIWDITK